MALIARPEFLGGLSEECGLAWLTWNSSKLHGWFEVKICWFYFGDTALWPELGRKVLLITLSLTGEALDQALKLSSN